MTIVAKNPAMEKLHTYKGFNLLNMFIKGPGDGMPFIERDFQTLSEWGFNFARIPMDYRFWVKGNNWDDVDESALERLDKAIEYGMKHNIHVCINLHRAPGYTVAFPPEATDLWTQKEPQEAFAKMWGCFAERYKSIGSECLSFNLVNEPRKMDEAVYAFVMKKAADAIRAIDSNRMIIADGRDYGRIPSSMIRDLGLVQGARGYDPITISHYKANWIEGSSDYPAPAWPPKECTGKSSDWLWDTVLKQWDDYIGNGGVIVGEWGSHNKTPHDVALRWMEDNLIAFKEHGLGWALWNLAGSFGVANSGRDDVLYEFSNGYYIDRKMLELLQKYI